MAVSRLPLRRGISLRFPETVAPFAAKTLQDPEGTEEWLKRALGFFAYAVVSSVAFSSVLSWFTPGTFIAVGDLPPFVHENLLSELWSLWGHQISGTGSPSYEIARAPELLALAIAKALGGDEVLAQMLFLAVIYVANACAVTYFAFAFVDRWWIAVASGLVAILNPFVMQALPTNIRTFAATALMAGAGGLIARAAKGHKVRPGMLAWLSLGASWLSLNPPLLLVAIIWIVVVLVGTVFWGGRRYFLPAVAYVLRAVPLAVLLNLWWLVPWVVTIFGSGTAVVVGAETDVGNWQFVHARSSFPNVLTLTSAWGWSEPSYYPYAQHLDAFPWGVLKFALPGCVLLGAFLARRERRRLVIVAMLSLLILTFLSKGLHSPWANANLFLYQHVPGMWLFREPAQKFGPAMLLVYTLMVALALEGAYYRWRRRRTVRGEAVLGATIALVMAAVIYPYPVWTGSVIPNERGGSIGPFPSAHVALPEAWRSIAASADRSPIQGKVLVLPITDYYQVGTTWGFYGVDVIPRQLLARATYQPTRGGYFTEPAEAADMLDAIESKIELGDDDSVRRLLEMLGVSHILLRHDILRHNISSFGSKADSLSAGLEKLHSLNLVESNEMASLYEISYADSALVQSDDKSVNLTWQQIGPSTYEVEVPASEEDFNIVLSESFDGGWQIRDLAPNRVLSHFAANGYANGWRIKAGATDRLVIAYRSQLLFLLAIIVSLMSALVMILMRFVPPSLLAVMRNRGHALSGGVVRRHWGSRGRRNSLEKRDDDLL